MDKVIRKVFFAWQLDKEKAFLEQKAKEGLLLKSVGLFRYCFEETCSKDLVYQFDFQIMKRRDEEEYLSLYEDWEFVDRFGSWYYFRKENDGKDVEIFNDIDSKRKMFLRLLGILFVVGFPLYYQMIIMFPRIIEEEGGLDPFYTIFRPIAGLLMLLHLFACLRIFLFYVSLKNNVSE